MRVKARVRGRVRARARARVRVRVKVGVKVGVGVRTWRASAARGSAARLRSGVEAEKAVSAPA